MKSSSSSSASLSDAVEGQSTAPAEDEVSDTEIEDDDDDGAPAGPGATNATAASCNAWASLQDQPIFEIFDNIEAQRRQQRWTAITAAAKEKSWLNSGNKKSKLSSIVME